MTESEAIRTATELFGDKYQWDTAIALQENRLRGTDEVWLVATTYGSSGVYALVDSHGGDLLLLAKRTGVDSQHLERQVITQVTNQTKKEIPQIIVVWVLLLLTVGMLARVLYLLDPNHFPL